MTIAKCRKIINKNENLLKKMTIFINIYKIKIRVRDDVAREHISIQIFYAFSKIFQNIIVELS